MGEATLRAVTASGTTYEFLDGRVRRLATGEAKAMRRDGDWLRLEEGTVPTVGQPLIMWLEPLGEGAGTWRRTTLVVSLDGDAGTGVPVTPPATALGVRAAMGDLDGAILLTVPGPEGRGADGGQ